MHIIHKNSKQGFTIIEVSLVLAIAGLIFLMIFVALPALQRQARDAKRREDTLTFINAIKKYQQNNRGALPEFKGPPRVINEYKWKEFYEKYLGDNFTNNSGAKYIDTDLVASCEKVPQGYSCGDLESGAMASTASILNNISTQPEEISDRIITFIGATCDSDNKPIGSSNPRNLAAVYVLESGGVYCANT